jgi:hypothetical protein
MSLAESTNSKAAKNIPRLDHDLIAQILSFCDAASLLLLLEGSCKFFTIPVSHTLSVRPSVCLSFLLKLIPNSINNDPRQQEAIIQLLRLIRDNRNFKYLECSNLRNVTGQEWLPRMKRFPIQNLDLSGCSSLDSDTLCQFLRECKASLRHLSLQGCIRIGPAVVDVIAEKHTQLLSLWLGGCSQAIGNRTIRPLLQTLQHLKHLDLQALKNITDLSGEFMRLLPASIQSLNFSSCKQLRLGGMEALEAIQVYTNHGNQQRGWNWNNAPRSRHQLRHIVLDTIGTPRIGLCRGILTYFALGRTLREVHLAGCEHVQDWEVEALAVTCAQTLTCFQMRASRIGNPALDALATHCKVLAEVDVSACFRVDDKGILALCESRQVISVAGDKRRRDHPILKALKVASLPGLTDRAVAAIANLEALHMLDIHDCPNVTSTALSKTIRRLPHIVDVNAKDIADECVSLPTLLRRHPNLPPGLRFLNQRIFSSPPTTTCTGRRHSCCTVRTHSQRLNKSAPLQTMLHCIDCQLLPAFDRGMCACCASKCHKGHDTFVGSWTRFYCDCPFAVAGNRCQAIFDEE